MAEIQSLARGLKILNYLGERGDGMGITELANLLEIDKSSASRLVQTLVKYEYAEPSRQSRGYQLGKKVQELSFAMRMNLPQIHARPFLKRLVEQTGESAHLAILIQGQALVIEDVETLETLRVDSGIGRFCPPHCTAIGKSLLAFNPLPLPQTLDPYTDKTILDKYELRQHMEQVRRQGYAVDDEEYTVGVRCLAAPVFDDSYGAVATIGISGPTVRVTHERLPEIATYVKQAAQALSITLGYTPTPV